MKDKQARIILALKNTQQPWYLSSLAKACNITYVHTTNTIKVFESLGLTTNEKHGKIKEIKLTERGAQLATLLEKIYEIINQAQKQQPEPKVPKEESPAAKEEKK